MALLAGCTQLKEDVTAPYCAPDAADFYVRSAESCRFTTVSAALEAARKSSASARTIHLAAGIYDDKTEKFPLDLRGGISLVGGGDAPEDTLIIGLGVLDNRKEGGAIAKGAAPLVSVVVGDPDVASQIVNLRLNSGANAGDRTFGVFCDRGNAISGRGAQPLPNLVVDHVVFEAGFGAGLAAAASTTPMAGCNLRVTSSRFEGDIRANPSPVGVETVLCPPETSSPPLTAIEVGDGDPTHGNLFRGLGNGNGSAGAVLVETCSASVIVHGNTFEDCDSGVHFIDDEKPRHYSIVGNTFRRSTAGGIYFQAGAFVDEVSDNTFTACDAGILIVGSSATILKARRNHFIGNDNGLLIDVMRVGFTAFSGFLDLGTEGSDGDNEFRCNATTTLSPGFDFAQKQPGGRVTAYGNLWDHVPPVVSSTQKNNGQDVLAPPTGSAPLVDGARQATSACPIDRVE